MYVLMPMAFEVKRAHRNGPSAVKTRLEQRLLDYRLSRMNGAVTARQVRIWDPVVLQKTFEQHPLSCDMPHNALQTLRNDTQNSRTYFLGHDLPCYVDVTATPTTALAWDVLEKDVFRGLTGAFRFQYRLPQADYSLLRSLMPFQDYEEHFRSSVPEHILLSLIQQLKEQFTETWYDHAYMPLRWLSRVTDDDVLLVKMNSSRVLTYGQARPMAVSVGPYNAEFQT